MALVLPTSKMLAYSSSLFESTRKSDARSALTSVRAYDCDSVANEYSFKSVKLAYKSVTVVHVTLPQLTGERCTVNIALCELPSL